MVTIDDIRLFYTVPTGPGGSTPQPDQFNSYGGFASHTTFASGQVNNLFGTAPGVDALPEYRCLFLVNISDTETWNSVKVFFKDIPTNGPKFYVGVDPTPTSEYTGESQQTIRPSSGKVSPSGVIFNQPDSYEYGVDVGSLQPGYGRGIWIKREYGTESNTSLITIKLSVGGIS